MNSIVCNETVKRKIIVSIDKIEGRLIYEGHKLGIPDELLPFIIRHHYEKYSSSFLFFNYQKWSSLYEMKEIKPTMFECWFKNVDSLKGLIESYNTLLSLMFDKFGKFKNIYIVEN